MSDKIKTMKAFTRIAINRLEMAVDLLTDEKLAEEFSFGGPRPREYAVMFLVSEIIHHEGQLAHARCCMKRQRGGD